MEEEELAMAELMKTNIDHALLKLTEKIKSMEGSIKTLQQDSSKLKENKNPGQSAGGNERIN